jgi:hypothetical protein
MDDVEAMGLRLPGGVKPSEFDYFHEMICHMEVNRLGRPGFIDSLGAGRACLSLAAVSHTLFHVCHIFSFGGLQHSARTQSFALATLLSHVSVARRHDDFRTRHLQLRD